MKNFEFNTLQEIAQETISKLNDGIGTGAHGADLHHFLFNQDYYIIGRYQAEQWLIKNTGVFNGISIVQEYEKDNFGEIYTDLSEAEKVCNMLVYIAGEEILSESSTLNDKWDDILTDCDIEEIIEELKTAFDL